MDPLILLIVAGAAGAAFLAARFRARKPDRRLTPSERRFLESLFPWLSRLDLPMRAAWERQVAHFLANITFEGCAGVTVTDDMRLVVAGQACLLALGRDRPAFSRLTTILIYPSGFSAPTTHAIGPNVTVEAKDERIGESWERGQVVLAWDEIDPEHRDPDLAGNLVFHEFAHQLDAENGQDDGVPDLPPGLNEDWQAVMGREYRRLRTEAARGREPFLDPYGAESPAEFFAVATESYFEEGEEMEKRHPDLYRVLKAFYRVDGASMAP